MKTLITLLLLLAGFEAHSQESFRKAFTLRDPIVMEGPKSVTLAEDTVILKADKLPGRYKEQKRKNKLFIITKIGAFELVEGTFDSDANQITLKSGAKINRYSVVVLKHDIEVPFASLTADEKAKQGLDYKVNDVVNYTIEKTLPPGKVTVSESVTITQGWLDKLKGKRTEVVKTLPAEEGFVKFDEDKIWVNPNLAAFGSNGLYYYQLTNRQTISLHFTDFTVSALTLPLKYRFKGSSNSKDFSEEFTTAINLNLFLGPTICGKTTFHYREKVGNISNTSKLTIGAIIGASTVTLDKVNTSAAAKPILDDTKIIKGLASCGLGAVYSYNKITGGAFVGWDFSVGDNSTSWNYNKQPWLGIAIGYSLFPF